MDLDGKIIFRMGSALNGGYWTRSNWYKVTRLSLESTSGRTKTKRTSTLRYLNLEVKKLFEYAPKRGSATIIESSENHINEE